MCHRAIEADGFGNMPRLVRRQRSTEKERKNRPDCKPATPRTLHSPRPETDWNVDWQKGGSAGYRRDQISDEKLPKSLSKRHFLRSCQKFKKIRKTFLQ
jgi:hypothetical protein